MNIREEKKYVYSMMEEITNERRKLSEMYFEMKKRLDKLDELEMRGLDDLSTQGYFDLYMKRDKQIKTLNIRREINHLNNPQPEPVTEESLQIFDESKEKMKEEVMKQMEQAVEAVENPVEEPKIPKKLIDEEKEKDKRKSSKQMDLSKVSSNIRTILKESGMPMSVKDIHRALEDKMDMAIDINNFRGNLLFRTLKMEPRVVRAGRGFYQYSFSNSSHIEIDKDKLNKDEGTTGK